MIVQALKTPLGDRNVSQQAIVDWLSDKITRMRATKPYLAAREYAKFAGKNMLDFDDLISGGATEEELKTFLSGPAEPYDLEATAPSNATGGYCVYRPSAPYQDEYDGSTLATCFTPCQNPLGCAPPTPTYDEFVKWGNAAGGHRHQQRHGFQRVVQRPGRTDRRLDHVRSGLVGGRLDPSRGRSRRSPCGHRAGVHYLPFRGRGR